MLIAAEKILDFYKLRTQSHINCVNYFAGLLGYQFPEHDGDKISGLIRTGYANIIYAKYHPEFTLTANQRELYDMAHAEHHKTQPHHLEYYNNDVSRISDMTLIEMICDWHSASFEQRYITHEDTIGYSVYDFWATRLHHLGWSPRQQALVLEMLEFLDTYARHENILDIWQPLLRDV